MIIVMNRSFSYFNSILNPHSNVLNDCLNKMCFKNVFIFLLYILILNSDEIRNFTQSASSFAYSSSIYSFPFVGLFFLDFSC